MPYIQRGDSLIGKSNFGGDQLFQGIIEDLRIYRTNLN